MALLNITVSQMLVRAKSSWAWQGWGVYIQEGWPVSAGCWQEVTVLCVDLSVGMQQDV